MLYITITLLHAGSAQPADCGATFHVNASSFEFVIVPGVRNCFSCSLDTKGSVLWQVTLPSSFIPTNVGPATAGFAEVDGNFLILPIPEDYVGPGFNGQRRIVCNGLLASSLFSPGREVSITSTLKCSNSLLL